MNGAVYISFFQGQLESALEQVVQLAVQEITKTVGSSLNSMLITTALKEDENRRLKLTLQSREFECKKGVGNGSEGAKEDYDTAAATERTKPETHTPSPGAERDVLADSQRLEQRGHVVGQLKRVMEQVLEFAMCELTKVVEASFDDLLLEMTKKEREHCALKERLCSAERQENGKAAASKRRGQDKDSASPGGSEGTKESVSVPAKIIRGAKEQLETTHDGDKQAVLTVAQDWVPILDKVFGQKWCRDLWQIQELSSDRGGVERSGGCPLPCLNALIRDNLVPSPTCPTLDPRWTPLEDMEVLSSTSDSQKERLASVRAAATVGESGLRSPSMLHRLLTLPAQLLEEEEDDDDDNNVIATLPAVSEVLSDRARSWQNAESPSQSLCPLKRKISVAQEEDEEEVEEEEEEEEDDNQLPTLDSKVNTGSLKGRKTHRCKECGKKFGSALFLKTHQQTHMTATPETRCSECGKRFSHAARLQAHLRMHSGKKH
ncbi:hypothetical protein DPEC_G00276520 [Dallia pectoralis]|uniref:Uncharacterized protein n=1 Tax=Dallia pectoralis TaxID=75939 RepID=A0ACC2FLJ0_DALPE|nr:hypothetical protein DPEC_G00276520 [Dallia pectoralis]